MADPRRTAARAVGSRVLEMHAGTPRLNQWYFDKFGETVRGDVLEVGSGLGNLSRILARHADTLCVTEVEEEYLEALEEQFSGEPHVSVSAVNLDDDLPRSIAQREFDVVISMNVLEHVREDHRAVRNLVSTLRSGGRLLTYVPACPFAYGPMDESLGHYRRYTREALRTLMTSAGLTVDKLEYMNLIGLAGWWFNNRVLRRQLPDPTQVQAFDRLVPLIRLEDRLRVPIGLGLVCHATLQERVSR